MCYATAKSNPIYASSSHRSMSWNCFPFSSFSLLPGKQEYERMYGGRGKVENKREIIAIVIERGNIIGEQERERERTFMHLSSSNISE